MAEVYSSSMDAGSFIIWIMVLTLPIFFITYGILTFDFVLILIGLIVNGLGTIAFVWPFMSAFYELEDASFVIKYWTIFTIPYEDIRAVKQVGGIHKIALCGGGYYCTNFKHRVLIQTKKGELIISPDKPKEFVKSMNEKLKLLSEIYALGKE